MKICFSDQYIIRHSNFYVFSITIINLSINNNIPDLRTIVLRKIEKEPFKIFFNSDFRSPKINQLKINNKCSVLFYDLIRKMQLRLQCRASINYKNTLSRKVWDKTSLQSRKCYMAPYPPSQKLKKC